MGLEILQVDAFTNHPFQGNPAAVCVLPEGHPRAQDASWMQSLAAEMNLSETAYLYQVADGFSLRWFTPPQSRWTSVGTQRSLAPMCFGRGAI